MERKSFILALVSLLSLTLAGSTRAQTFYVAPDTGTYFTDGTEASPWPSIGHAITRVPDGSVIVVTPGAYEGPVLLQGTFVQGVTIKSQATYGARLYNTEGETVVTCSGCRGVAMQGFRIAGYSTGQTLVDIGSGASNIRLEQNLFVDSGGDGQQVVIDDVSDATIQDCIFASGNPGGEHGRTQSPDGLLTIRDSNGPMEGFAGSQRIVVRRNIFLSLQGSANLYLLRVGGGNASGFEAQQILMENNLLIGNSGTVLEAALGIFGARGVTFRNNTTVGDMPSNAFAMHLDTGDATQPNAAISFYNNIWSDWTGTMGVEGTQEEGAFSNTPVGGTVSHTLHSNLYWNGDNDIPADASDLISYTDDAAAVLADPLLPNPAYASVGGEPNSGTFVQLVLLYGNPSYDSPAIGAADPNHAPDHDILGNPRPDTSAPAIGACEHVETALKILTEHLPAAEEYATYWARLQAMGGRPPYTWSIVEGTIAPDFELDPATGVITGRYMGFDYGYLYFTVQVTDSASPPASATRELDLDLTGYGRGDDTRGPHCLCTVPGHTNRGARGPVVLLVLVLLVYVGFRRFFRP